MAYHRTMYELAVINGSGELRFLVAYCDRKTRQMLFKACRARDTALAKLTGAEKITFAQRAADGATMGDWVIRFTGRTRLECKQPGRELPYIGRLYPAAA